MNYYYLHGAPFLKDFFRFGENFELHEFLIKMKRQRSSYTNPTIKNLWFVAHFLSTIIITFGSDSIVSYQMFRLKINIHEYEKEKIYGARSYTIISNSYNLKTYTEKKDIMTKMEKV